MEEQKKEKSDLTVVLITICRELGCDRQGLENLSFWELQDLIIKDIHIRRITMERDKKKISNLERNLRVLKQKTFPFIGAMQPWN